MNKKVKNKMKKKNDIGSTKLARAINKMQRGVLGDMQKKGKRAIRSVPMLKTPNFRSII